MSDILKYFSNIDAFSDPPTKFFDKFGFSIRHEIYEDERYMYYYYNNATGDGPRYWWDRKQRRIGADITHEINGWLQANNFPPIEQWTTKEKVLFKLKFH